MKKNTFKKCIIFVISGPSGSGKTTLVGRLIKQRSFRGLLVRSVSVTTRARRPKEKNARDYFFVSPRRFHQLRRAEKFLEWTRYLGYYYATSKEFIDLELKNGKNVILCLDIRGARAVKGIYPGNTVIIFVLPPSMEILAERIKNRRDRTGSAEINKRLCLAKKELQAARGYDYCIANRDLSAATKKLGSIILKEVTRRSNEATI